VFISECVEMQADRLCGFKYLHQIGNRSAKVAIKDVHNRLLLLTSWVIL
jgi:hypothetical protein